MPTPESALTSLALRNFETLRERLLADVLGTLPELMQRVSVPLGPRVAERLADASDPTGGIPGFPQGFLQRVASAPPLGVANLPTLVAPTDPALESPRMVSTVQLASSEGSPAATSSPAKRPRKRPTSKGKATEGQLEKAPSVKRRPARPLSPMPNPLTNPEDDPPQSAPQNPGGGQGAAADPSSMGPNRTFSEWSEEPAAEVGGQGTRRPLKKPHDVPPPGGTLSAHSSGGGSAAGSLSETAAPIKGEGPKERDEGFTRNRAQNRQDRIKRWVPVNQGLKETN